MRSMLMELIGTFFLVLVVGLTVITPGAGTMAPLAIGAVLMVMIYAGGHVSGAHYNPAVTLAVWLAGKCSAKIVPGYMASQIVGASLAAMMVGYIKSGSDINSATPEILPALLAEWVFTFALAFVVLSVATAKKTEGNSYFGLAIGFTVVAGIYAVGNISGAVFNPAVAIGILLMGLIDASNLWIFLVANLAGGALAALAFRKMNPDG